MKKILHLTFFILIFTLFIFYTTGIVQALNISSNAVTGNWSAPGSWSGGVVPTKNDSVIIVSGSNITVDIDTCKAYKMRINSGGTVNCSSHILKLYGGTVSKVISSVTYTYIGNGSLTIYGGGTFNLNSGTLALTGNFVTDGTFNCGTGTVIFDTKRAIITMWGANIPTFYNIINNDSVPGSYPISGGFGVTLHPDNTIIKGNLVINGSFNRNSSAVNDSVDITFDGNTTLSGVFSLYLNDVIINSGATLNMSNKNIYLYGNWICNGSFTCGTSTIYFSRDPNNQLQQTIYQANPDLNPFYNIYINKSSGSVTQIPGTANTPGNIYVLNNFTVNRGTYDVGGVRRTYVGGNFIVNSGNGGIFTANQGRVLMNGSAQQTLTAGTSSLYKLTIDNTSGVILGSDLTVTYEIQFTNGIMYTKNGGSLYECYLSNSDPTLSLPAGYSSTSFIIGKFRRAVTGSNSYVYPVGPMNTIPVKYRPVTYNQTAANGATSLFVSQDAVSNTGTYNANWWSQIQPDAGNPTGSLIFRYDLTNDFPVGMTECNISAMRGVIPSPTNWNYVLTTTVAPSGGSNGSLTASIPATMAPYAYILGEPASTLTGTTICSGNSTSLNVASPTGWGSFNWYDASTGGNLLQASSTTYNTPVLNNTTTYYVAYVNTLTGCMSHRTPVTVTVIAAPSVNAGNNANVCAGNAYTLSGTSASNYTSLNWTSSGTGSFTNNGTTTPTYTPSAADISAGTVTLTMNATGNAPCGTYNDAMVLSIVALPTANAGSNTTICSGLSANLSASGGSTYAWSPSTGLSATNISNPVASPVSTTTYIVTVTNAGGCSATDDIVVNVNATPNANAGTDVSIPFGTTTTLSGSASGGSGSYTYSWSPSGSLTNPSAQNPTTTSLTTTTIFTLTVTDNSTGCQKTDQVVVTVTGGALSVGVSAAPTTICAGQNVTLYASPSGGSGTYSYSWTSNPAGFSSIQQSPTVAPTSSTIYSVTINDGFNSVSGAVAVTVNPLPNAEAGSNVAICSGTSTPLSASGGTSYLWSPSTGLSASNISNPYASPSNSTTYTVTVTSAQGCSASDNLTLTVNPVPTANAGSDVSVCSGQSVSLNASGGSSYQWSPASGLSSATISNPVASPTNTTSYTVTVTNSQGCTDSDALTVTVNSLPTANAGNDESICFGGSVVLNANGGALYAWSPTNGLDNSNIQNPTASPQTTTNYYVTVTSVNGCSATDDVQVTVFPLPTADAGQDNSICMGSQIQLNASGGTLYLWSPAGSLNNSTVNNPTASPNATTTYAVIVTDNNSCSATDEVTITVNPLPTANAGADVSICEGENILVSATGGINYSWNNGENTSSFTVQPATSTSYIVTVSDNNNCTASDEIFVTVTALPVISISCDAIANSAYVGQEVTVSVDPSGLSIYSFFIDTMLVQTGSENTYSSTTFTNGQNVLIIASENGCTSAMDSITILIRQIPNAFTPKNKDGVNDIFLKGLNLTVFNRWGQEIYSGNEGWDGKHNEVYVSGGTYYFRVKLSDANSVEQIINGSVTVIE